MKFDNTGLAALAEKALKENWGYCLGAFGNTMTESFLAQKCSQGSGVGQYNTSHKDYLKRFMGKKVSDCYGLVKAYLWTDELGNVKYNPAQDRNQESAYNAAKEKGALKAMPEIPGLVLWMPGHAGIYIGNGEFIECAGAPTGMRRGKIANGAVVSGSRFQSWFKDDLISYAEPTAEEAINRLHKKGVIENPDYWKDCYRDVKYLDLLFIKMAANLG